MHRLGFGPEAAAPSVPKEGAGFAIHPLVFTAGGQGEQKNEERGEGKLALAAKRLGRGIAIGRRELAGNELEKRLENT